MSKERWFANLVLLGASAACISASVMAYGTAREYTSGTLREAVLIGGPFLLGVGLLACLWSPVSFRVALSMTLLSLAVTAYTAEAFLQALPGIRVRHAARRFGIQYDPRTQLDVVRDLRRQGIDAYPAVFSAWHGLEAEDGDLLPLGGISAVMTVFCSEMGRYIVYRSDEHGFHNPEGTWSFRVFDVAALGDSFTQGACVPSDENFMALIRREFPATLNLGMLGNGPLLMLAGLKEFLVDLEPKVVLWVYTEGNDLLFDLEREKRSSLLVDYLAPGHRQGLIKRQGEVDALLRALIDREYEERLAGAGGISAPPRFWRLWALRQALGLYVAEERLNPFRVDVRVFREILDEARKAVRGWGGEIYFVYLPAEGRYVDARHRRNSDWTRERVLSIVRDLRLPLVDLDPRMSRHPHRTELYSHRGAHFSPAGNRLVAETILEALRAARAD